MWGVSVRRVDLAEVNHVLALTTIFEFDARSVFRAQADRLKSAGL